MVWGNFPLMWADGLRIHNRVSFSSIQSNQWWWIRKMVGFLSWRWWNISHIISNHGSLAQISSLQVDEAWGLPKNQIRGSLSHENFPYPVLDFWELDVSRPMMGVSGPQILSNQITGSLPSYHINFSYHAASNHIKSRGQAAGRWEFPAIDVSGLCHVWMWYAVILSRPWCDVSGMCKNFSWSDLRARRKKAPPFGGAVVYTM